VSYLLVGLVAFGAAMLTFFSGFGLGTLLLPAFSLFFPVTLAVAATAVVHLANNLFKLALVGRAADRGVLLRFALPAAAAAVAGAALLAAFSQLPPIAEYTLGGRRHEVLPVKLVIGALMAGFSILELSVRFQRLTFARSLLPLGGIVSGFFGGLSGHQGAFRSAFLIKSGLSKEAFIATGVASAVVIDLSRLAVYGAAFFTERIAAVAEGRGAALVTTATLCAFAGSYVGSRAVRKVTLRGLQILVATGLVLLGSALAAGLI
jgi:uncharacterized membrane protein YfcA